MKLEQWIHAIIFYTVIGICVKLVEKITIWITPVKQQKKVKDYFEPIQWEEGMFTAAQWNDPDYIFPDQKTVVNVTPETKQLISSSSSQKT